MEKLLKFIRIFLSVIINIVMLAGIAIVLLWLIWDITPQTSITKAAYFFSDSWHLVTGRRPSEKNPDVVLPEQLQDSAAHTMYIGRKTK